MKTQNLNRIEKTALCIVLLFLAACQGNETGAQSQTKSQVSQPAVDLHTAVLQDNLEAVKQHIAAGSDLNIKDPFGGSSPLISAALFGKTEAAWLLLNAGVDINFQNNDGSTALHTAAFFGRPEIVKLLLDKKADKALKNKYGATPYDNVAGPFDQVKSVYKMMEKALGPMGLKLDYTYLEKVRPEIAAMLK
jgi:ankyrin repeat protein